MHDEVFLDIRRKANSKGKSKAEAELPRKSTTPFPKVGCTHLAVHLGVVSQLNHLCE